MQLGISTLGSTIRLTFNPPKVKNTTALGNGSSSLGLGLSTGLGGSAETENSGNLTEFKVVGISGRVAWDVELPFLTINFDDGYGSPIEYG